jgi:hypothetical protein
MGFSLMGPHGEFHINNGGWGWLLELEYQNGWRPEGTIFNCSGPYANIPVGGWRGNFYNEGQLVTEEDAAALATALYRALDDLPLDEAMIGESAYRRAKIAEFADFCAHGEFRLFWLSMPAPTGANANGRRDGRGRNVHALTIHHFPPVARRKNSRRRDKRVARRRGRRADGVVAIIGQARCIEWPVYAVNLSMMKAMAMRPRSARSQAL